jgi:hypothetical protein
MAFGKMFGGTLGIGCALLTLVVALPVGCMMIIGGCFVATSSAVKTGHEAAERAKHDETSSAHTPATSSSSGQPEEKPAKSEVRSAQPVNRLTLENYSRIEDGMTYEKVKSILGPASEEAASASAGQGTEFATKMVVLTWKGSWGANAVITFQDGRVTAKAQFGLSHGEATSDLPTAEDAKKANDAEMAAAQRRMAAAQAEDARKRAEERRQVEAKHQAAIEKAKWHTWTSADKKFTVEAKFVKAVVGTIYLEKRDGTVIQIPQEKLCDDDWEWIKNKSWNDASE